MDERVELAFRIAYNVAYLVAVGAVLLMVMPGVRPWLDQVAGRQVHSWRYGRWLAGRPPAPAWTRQLAREDLPQERA